ncbi:diguanylate cyclase [Chromobacterium vaccinii]|uniref:GGDEF domain-containing protein n=1 Tax=Chromobacterium TaxID=535 RepID=UPI0013054585|nr:GGDEF domain-containing protein [Chromobacterium sp. ATCC 53434]
MRLSRIFIIATAILFVLVSLPLAWIISSEWSLYHATDDGLEAIRVARLAMVAAERVSYERGPANALLGTVPDQAKLKRMSQVRRDSDFALRTLLAALSPGVSADHRQANQAAQQARRLLTQARGAVDAAAAEPSRTAGQMMGAVRRMFDVIPPLLEAVAALSSHASAVHPQLANPLSGARLATELREYAGRLGSQLTAALALGRPLTADEKQEVDVLRGRIEQLRSTIKLRLSVPATPPATRLAARQMEQRYFGAGMALVNAVVQAGEQGRAYPVDTAGFASHYVPTMATIITLRDAMLTAAAAEALQQHRAALHHLLSAVGLGVIGLLAQLALFFYIRRQLVQPLLAASRLLTDIAQGRLEAAVPEPRRDNEIGEVLRAIAALRRSSLEKRTLEQERQRLIDELTEISRIDFLTGIANRRAFTEAAEAEISRAGRDGTPAALILFDIDHFKQVNDRHGHDVGDAALKHVAAMIARACREGDLAGRYGGEEFVVLTGSGGEAAGAVLAERLRAGIAETPLRLASGQTLALTASFGVAALDEAHRTLHSLLQAADHALYAAKRQGRDQVVRAGQEENEG